MEFKRFADLKLRPVHLATEAVADLKFGHYMIQRDTLDEEFVFLFDGVFAGS